MINFRKIIKFFHPAASLDEPGRAERAAADMAPALGAQSQGNTDTATEASGNAGGKAQKSVLSSSCPYCSSKNFVKRGTRQKRGGKVQLYICRDCRRTFTPAWIKNRQHGWSVILEAISYYNLGFSLAQTCDILKQKFQVEVQPSTIAAWVNDNKEICAYHRMRDFAVKHFSPYEVVETCTLAHRQLYRFRYHRAKTKYIMEDDFKHYKFYPLKEFLENVSTETPHQYFSEGLRASEAPLKFSKQEMIVRSKENYATKLTELVFKGVSDNKQRHEALQRFLIANDTVTVATEVPVYIKREDLAHMQTQLGFQMYTSENLKSQAPISKSQTNLNVQNPNDKKKKKEDDNLQSMTPDELPKLITGHIDFLQIRNGSIHILDYKGEGAAKVRPIEQLTLYALALSRLTGLRLFYFKCAWFDEKDYFEFFPLHVVYKPKRGRRKIYTKEGVYNMNENMNRMESLRPIDDGRTKVKIGKPNF
jgi:transposase-like protein